MRALSALLFDACSMAMECNRPAADFQIFRQQAVTKPMGEAKRSQQPPGPPTHIYAALASCGSTLGTITDPAFAASGNFGAPNCGIGIAPALAASSNVLVENLA